ncbi:nuclear transport factor 2 family protein [Brevundimonas sp. NPDC092305]|uniref:nuclear transport factor 2 family protein n=1 Tax=Brevundimonas sp. NPDC092305 TaxID=3363957 RepID=UPI0038011E00
MATEIAMHRLALLTLPVFAVTSPALAQTPNAAPVIAAERAFAADGARLGIAASFNTWAAPEAIVIGPQGVQRVPDAYPPGTPRPADEPLLEWWPTSAGISRSGELGFTTGGVQVAGRRSGHYFTIWKEQTDGSWKWVYDGGSVASAANVPGQESEPVILPPGPGLIQVLRPGPTDTAPLASEGAMNAVRELEAELARAAVTDQRAAHLAQLADNGRLYVASQPPAIGRDAFAQALNAWPSTFRFGPTEGGGASTYGDLVWTYGKAVWTRDGQARQGYYVRLWQSQEAGWKIVLAQLVPVSPNP